MVSVLFAHMNSICVSRYTVELLIKVVTPIIEASFCLLNKRFISIATSGGQILFTLMEGAGVAT
jgi:hypothetical protein